MRKSSFVFVGCIFFSGALAFWWWFGHQVKPQPISPASSTLKPQKQNTNAAESTAEKADANIPKEVLEEKPLSYDEKMAAIVKKSMVPIIFYGKVIDENGNPVDEADIVFSVSDLSPECATSYHRKSDSQGLFSFKGVKGSGMSVDVSKDGYYTPQSAHRRFEYSSEDERHIPDVNTPVVFQLRKKGATAELVRFEKNYRIPKDGSPVEIDLLTGKGIKVGQGQLKIECWTMDQNKVTGIKNYPIYDWKCRISIPGGGLIESTKEFDFEAPSEGYRPFDEINMPTTVGQNWKRQVEKHYFLKLPNGNYARINFEMIAAGDHFCRIESYLNPDKSRNLEYDKSKEIEVREK